MTSTLIFVAVSLLIAGSVKGMFGVGLPAVSLGLLSLWMPPVEAAALIVMPTVTTNAWQFLAGSNRRRLATRLATLLIGIIFGTVAGVGFLTGSDTNAVALALGCVLIAYAAIGLFAIRLHVPAHLQRWASPLIGLATGAVNGATGVSVMPLVPYLNSIGLDRDTLIQAMGLVFLFAMLTLATCLAITGHFQWMSAGASALALVPVFCGMYVGQRVRVRLHADDFRKWFFIGLIALGTYSAIRATLRLAAM